MIDHNEVRRLLAANVASSQRLRGQYHKQDRAEALISEIRENLEMVELLLAEADVPEVAEEPEPAVSPSLAVGGDANPFPGSEGE